MPNPLDRFKRLFERKSYTLTDPDFPLSIFGITHSASGIPVTAANAMRVPAVAATVELIATAIGTLPVKVYKRTPLMEMHILQENGSPEWISDRLRNPWKSWSFCDINDSGRIGWGTWIRTRTNGVRVRGSTVNLFPSRCGLAARFASARGRRKWRLFSGTRWRFQARNFTSLSQALQEEGAAA